MAEILQISIDRIKVANHVLRMEGEDDALNELSASIRRVGIIVPLVVSPAGDSFNLIAGHRRLAAAKRAGLQKVPCCEREDNASLGAEISFAENLFRKDLSPVEIAAGIKDVLDQGIMELDELAASMHRSEYWVNRQLSMLDWPADVLEVLHNGKISTAAASNIAMVSDDTYRAFLLRNAVDQGASARTTAAWLQAWRSSAPPQEAIEAEPVSGESRPTPMVPQAPCIVCGQVFRTDQLSHVPVCAGCINAIRQVGG